MTDWVSCTEPCSRAATRRASVRRCSCSTFARAAPSTRRWALRSASRTVGVRPCDSGSVTTTRVVPCATSRIPAAAGIAVVASSTASTGRSGPSTASPPDCTSNASPSTRGCTTSPSSSSWVPHSRTVARPTVASASSVPASRASHARRAEAPAGPLPFASAASPSTANSRTRVFGSPIATIVCPSGTSAGSIGSMSAPGSARSRKWRRPLGSASVPGCRKTLSAPRPTSRAAPDASSAKGLVAS